MLDGIALKIILIRIVSTGIYQILTMFIGKYALGLRWVKGTDGNIFDRRCEAGGDDGAVMDFVAGFHRPAFRDELADVFGNGGVTDAVCIAVRVAVDGFAFFTGEAVGHESFCHCAPSRTKAFGLSSPV